MKVSSYTTENLTAYWLVQTRENLNRREGKTDRKLGFSYLPFKCSLVKIQNSRITIIIIHKELTFFLGAKLDSLMSLIRVILLTSLHTCAIILRDHLLFGSCEDPNLDPSTSTRIQIWFRPPQAGSKSRSVHLNQDPILDLSTSTRIQIWIHLPQPGSKSGSIFLSQDPNLDPSTSTRIKNWIRPPQPGFKSGSVHLNQDPNLDPSTSTRINNSLHFANYIRW